MLSDSQGELSRKLDQALAPPQPPGGMNERIVQGTRQHLPMRASVLARLGGQWLRLAAAVALAAGVGAVIYARPALGPASQPTASVASISAELSRLADDQPPATVLDRQIDRLQAQLASAASENVWDDPQIQIDDVIAQPQSHHHAYPANSQSVIKF